MARTVFAITADGEEAAFPNNSGWPVSQGGSMQNIQRYRALTLKDELQYPLSNDDFNVAFARFKFLDAFGGKITEAPNVKIKLPPQFNINQVAEYMKGDAIFGAGSGNENVYNTVSSGAYSQARTAGGDGFDAENFALTAAQALQYSLEAGLNSALGFAGSAGLGNISQYEFSRRQALNPMSQMLYKGPGFRRYGLPFMMRPRSSSEAKHIKNIVSAFRLAAAPSVPDTNDALLGDGATFLFGYPHLVQFDLIFYPPEGGVDFLYRSKPCVIEGVSSDYGGQKMTFHEDGYPTETTLNLSLIEINPRVLGDEQDAARHENRRLA